MTHTHWKVAPGEKKDDGGGESSGWPNAIVMLGLYALIAFILQLIIR